MKDILVGADFLPNGELIVRALGAIQRRDASGKKVLAKLKSKFGAYAVSSSGRLFVATGNKVFEHDVATLKPKGKPLAFPSERGGMGELVSLAISPDESTLAGITQGNTLHVQDLGSATHESHGGYGARREALAFLGPRTFLNVRGNTIAEVRTLGGGHADAELHGVNFASGGVGHFVAWNIGEEGKLYDAKGKLLGALSVKPLRAVFVNDVVVISSEDAVTVFDVKSRKQRSRFALKTSGVLAVGSSHVVTDGDDGLVLLSFPELKPLSAVPKPAPAPVVAAPVVKKEKPAKPSALRTKLEKLGATSLGGSVTTAQLTAAKKKLGHAVPAPLAAFWTDVDGFCIHESAGGVNGLRAFLETESEDVLWNDDFEEGPTPLAKLKKLKVLWSLPGQPEAVGIDTKTGALFFGEPNDVKPLKLTLAKYLELALDPDFLEKIRR